MQTSHLLLVSLPLRSIFKMSWLCLTQVAEIISDVREPITEASQPVDENESRRQQVQVGSRLSAESTCALASICN